MDYLFLHRDKRTFTSERQKNLLFRAARIYWEQKFANCEPEKARKVDCELYKYVLYYLEVVCASISKPSWAANLTARNILSASSLNLSCAQPTHLITCAFKSPMPSNSSTSPIL